MAKKPASTVRVGMRKTKSGDVKVVTTKKGSGAMDALLKKLGR
jgi:hypothetical protein